jgi:predicted ArsR family transcriptional regulator
MLSGFVAIDMTERERSESGQFVETVTDARVLEVFDRIDAPAITSRDVAETIGCTGEAARRKLARLREQGRVARRKSGRTVVWWRLDEDTDDADLKAQYEAGFGAFAADSNFAEQVDRAHASLGDDFEERA